MKIPKAKRAKNRNRKQHFRDSQKKEKETKAMEGASGTEQF